MEGEGRRLESMHSHQRLHLHCLKLLVSLNPSAKSPQVAIFTVPSSTLMGTDGGRNRRFSRSLGPLTRPTGRSLSPRSYNHYRTDIFIVIQLLTPRIFNRDIRPRRSGGDLPFAEITSLLYKRYGTLVYSISPIMIQRSFQGIPVHIGTLGVN